MIRDVTWYPGATYKLIIAANGYQMKEIPVTAPATCPTGIVELGELEFERGCLIDNADLLGRNSISVLDYDNDNSEYYERLFDRLTRGKSHDQEKIDALHQYVVTRLTAVEGLDNSARQVFENGTRFCGNLALALATLAAAGDYRARLVDLVDEARDSSAHMVTEIYYDDRWHLYDPTAGFASRNKDGRVASYKDLRLDPYRAPQLPIHLPGFAKGSNDWTVGIYRSGYHHYYYFRSKQ